MLISKRRIFVAGALTVLASFGFGAKAQSNWPNGQTVRVIVPFQAVPVTSIRE